MMRHSVDIHDRENDAFEFKIYSSMFNKMIMKAVNIVFMLIFSFMLLACLETSEDELPGKYVNTYEKDAEHYVILKTDSTFFIITKRMARRLT